MVEQLTMKELNFQMLLNNTTRMKNKIISTSMYLGTKPINSIQFKYQKSQTKIC